MIAPEVQKRLTIIGLVVVGVSAVIFTIFAFFLNRSTLILSGEPPFRVDISNLKTEYCTEKDCTLTLAPGKYTLTISKDGYKTIQEQVELSIAGKNTQNLEFEFVPLLREVHESTISDLFVKPQVPAELKDIKPIFLGDGYAAYLKNSPDTHRQTLYLRGTAGAELGPETAITSFTRSMKNYRLFLNLDGNSKIGLIEDDDTGSTFYVIDTAAKTRTNLFSYPNIKSVKWFPKSDNFLFEAREGGDIATSIFLYKPADAANKDAKITKLNLQTPLENVAIQDQENLWAVTTQSVQGAENPALAEGKLVVLTENEASPDLSDLAEGVTLTLNTPKVIQYSLVSNQVRLVKNMDGVDAIEEVIMNENKKSLYLKMGEKILEFVFSD